jgi:hypothetical protein
MIVHGLLVFESYATTVIRFFLGFALGCGVLGVAVRSLLYS